MSSESTTDFQKESGLGMIDYHAVTEFSKKSKRKDRKIQKNKNSV